MIIQFTNPVELGKALNREMANCQVSGRLRGDGRDSTQWAIEARMNDNLIAAVLLADFDPTRNDLSLGENWVSIRTDDADESLKMSRLTEAESLRDRLFEKLVDLQ